MATQSGSSATNHSVIQSSIALALLQERFLQLQKDKEMRQRKQLLKNATTAAPVTTTSSRMDLPASNTIIKNPPAAATDHDNLFIDCSEHHYSPPNSTTPNDLKISLSLWPVSSHAYSNSPGVKKGDHHISAANYSPPLNDDVTLLSNSCIKFRSVHYQSVPDVVDTSLHL